MCRCYVCRVCANRSQVQRWLAYQKCWRSNSWFLPPNFKISFIDIVMVWLCRTRSNRYHFTKNMIWHRTMGSIYWPSNTGIRSTDETTFIQCVDDQEPNIQKLRCLGLDNITKDVHSTAQVEVVSGTMGKFTIDYLSENGRSIQIIRQLSINDSVQFLRIPDFVGGIGLSFLPNLKYPVESIVWGNGGTSNHNWGGSRFGL